MTDWKAWLWDKLLTAYGMAPYHPGKWRAMQRLQRRAAPEWNTPRVVRRHGVLYELDLRDHVPRWVYLNTYEALETRFIERLVRPGWTAIDVGANIGYFTCLLAHLVSPTGRIFAFEPTGRCYENLVHNVALNGFNNVRTLRLAVGDACRPVSLFSNPNPSKTRISMTADNPNNEVVPMLTLDRFVDEERLVRVDFVKVDIEGAENLFLAGAEKTLARFRPIVMIELNASALARFDATPAHVIDQLTSHGYRLFRVTWHGLTPLPGFPPQRGYWNVFAFAS